MTVTLDLPPIMVAQLKEEADQNAEPLEDYLKLMILQSMPKPRNGAEQVAMLEAAGIIGMWAAREDIGDSLEFARRLRKQAETRDWS